MIDTALREREAARKPIRVGMVGAGATGRAIALQLGTPAPGIRLVAMANRTAAHGERALREAGISEWTRVDTAAEAGAAIARGAVAADRRSVGADRVRRDRPDRRGHRDDCRCRRRGAARV